MGLVAVKIFSFSCGKVLVIYHDTIEHGFLVVERKLERGIVKGWKDIDFTMNVEELNKILCKTMVHYVLKP